MSEPLPSSCAPTRDAERLLAGFDRLGLDRTFTGPEAGLEYLQATDYETASRQYDWLHGIGCGVPPAQRAPVTSGQLSVVQGGPDGSPFDPWAAHSSDLEYLAPHPDVGLPLMESLYQTAQTSDEPLAAAMLIRLGIYLSQRHLDGNSSGSTISYRLLTAGYDGSDDDRYVYGTLLQGRKGARRVAMEIDTGILAARFCRDALRRTAERRGVQGPMPIAMDGFMLADLHKPDAGVPPEVAIQVGKCLAETHFGLTLAANYAMQHDVLAELVDDTLPGAPVLETERFIEALEPNDYIALALQSEHLKCSFLQAIIDCYAGRRSPLGDPQTVSREIQVQPWRP